MKKALALLIAVLMVAALAACTTSTPDPTPTPTPASTPTPPPDDGPETPDATVDPSTVDVSAAENLVGYFDDGVDPNSRDTYEIAWMYMRPMALFLSLGDTMRDLESKFNVKISEYCANSDIDALLQNIEIFADQGIDGYIIVIDATANVRIKEVLDLTGLPYIAILNSVRDESGSAIVHCIGMEGVTVGEEICQWLYDNYKNYWGDIDTSKIGLLDFTFSPNVDFHDRYLGVMSKFEELLPGNPTYTADGVTGGLNEETGYDLAAGIFAANPQVEYWFVPACLELYANGAKAAAEAIGIQDKVLILSVNHDVLVPLWEGGYEGCFVACVVTTAYQYCVPALCGITSILNGTSTVESLWSTRRLPSDDLTFYEMEYEICTIDTYADYIALMKSESGL